MTIAENLFSNMLTVLILLFLAILIYSRVTGKTIPDMVREIREAFSSKTVEVVDSVPGFEGIR